mgnify:CR=1 FL=1
MRLMVPIDLSLIIVTLATSPVAQVVVTYEWDVTYTSAFDQFHQLRLQDSSSGRERDTHKHIIE